jgi:Amidase
MTTTSPAIEMAALDAVAQADLIRRGEVTPAELAERAIERIGELNPALNAVITPMYEQALATAAAMPATGPLAGVPFLVKDLITEVAGVPFSEGSASCAATSRTPTPNSSSGCGAPGWWSSWARPRPLNSGWRRPVSQLETARPWPSRMPPITAGTGTSGMTQVPD